MDKFVDSINEFGKDFFYWLTKLLDAIFGDNI
jgi:hypothetical protein